jgi:hypothetical protein
VLDDYFGSGEFITGEAARALHLIDLPPGLEVKAIHLLTAMQEPAAAP